MTTSDVQLLAQQYRSNAATLSEKEKASMERAMWAMATSEDRKDQRRDFLKKVSGADVGATDTRSFLLSWGEDVDVLWRRIETKEMTLREAVRLMREVKKIVFTTNAKVSDVLQRALHDFDNPDTTQKPLGISKKVVAKMQEAGEDRAFWVELRKYVITYMQQKYDYLDPSSSELLVRDFETDLKVLVEQFRSSIRNVQRRNEKTVVAVATAVSKKRLSEACATLHMDPPTHNGQQVDMDKARKQKKALARSYHPDANGGDETLREKYLEVIEAYQTIEAYSKQLHIVPTQSTGTDTNNANRNEDRGSHDR